MREILSLQNDHIKDLVRLAHEASERKHQQKFIAEGIRTVSTLLKSKMHLVELISTHFMLMQAHEVAPDEKITVVSDAVLNKISPSSSPSGILGVFEIPQHAKNEPLSSGIVLSGISDPGNMGTLIRTCAAIGKKTVVVLEGVDPFNPKVIQATAGAIGLVNIFQCTWPEFLTRKKDMQLFGLVVQDGKPMHKLAENSLLMIGSEAHGIPEEYLSACDELITLSMPGGTESLNAAIAGSIAMYLGFL
ncbi:MAG TPA: RNA methyltransferase [Candidatus Babeliales bacterium]|nr:RNA methyltransferase [Candidatus Babeliales bacterium]